MTATNAFGIGAQSDVIEIIAEFKKDPPGAPILSNDEEVTSANKIGLKWTSPSTGGAVITDYMINWKLPSETEFKLLKSGITDTKFEFTEF